MENSYRLSIGLRVLLQKPGFNRRCLAGRWSLGIGANSAVFSLGGRAAAQPLPGENTDRLVALTPSDYHEATRTAFLPAITIDTATAVKSFRNDCLSSIRWARGSAGRTSASLA